jgi:hypothetical protein
MTRTTRSEPIDTAVQVAHINRRTAVVTALCGVLVALIGAFGAYLAGRKHGVDIATEASVTVTKTITTGTAPALTPGDEPNVRTSSAPSNSNSVPEQVQLDADTGIDLDAVAPQPTSASGPNGDLDLHFDGTSLTAGRSGLFHYFGTEGDARVGCPKIVASERPVAGGVYTGDFCLRTSAGTIGWVNVNDVKMDDETGYMVVNYKLFSDL